MMLFWIEFLVHSCIDFNDKRIVYTGPRHNRNWPNLKEKLTYFSQLWVKKYHSCSSTRMALALNNPRILLSLFNGMSKKNGKKFARWIYHYNLPKLTHTTQSTV